MAAQTRATLLANAAANLADNSSAALDAADVRQSVVDLIDSAEIGLENLFRILDADVAHNNNNSAQQWFATAGVAAVPLAGVYKFEGLLRVTHGISSHTTAILFGGTAPTWIEYFSVHQTAALNNFATLQSTKLNSAITAQTLSGAVTSVEEGISIDGLVEFPTTGTFIPQFQYSTTPGTTTLTKRGTRFSLRYLGDTSFTTRGTWT